MHKHKLHLVRRGLGSPVLIKTQCSSCGQKFTYLKASIHRMLLRTSKYQPTFLMGNW